MKNQTFWEFYLCKANYVNRRKLNSFNFVMNIKFAIFILFNEKNFLNYSFQFLVKKTIDVDGNL